MRTVMMGTGIFAEPTLETLLASGFEVVGIFTQPDRGTGEERASTRQVGKGIKNIGLAAGIPVFQPASINQPEEVTALEKLRPDLLVVAAYGQILSPEILATAKLGGVNVHASLLPKYRGASPVQRAIANGEKETGVSILQMTSTLDGGSILATQATPIAPDETAGELENRLSLIGAKLALETVNRLREGPIQGSPQNPLLATKAPKLKKEHGLILWDGQADLIECHIRAMQPWPTAFTYWKRIGVPPIRLQILKAKVLATNIENPVNPGVLVKPVEQKMVVKTGACACLEILELVPSGKKKMAGADFLRGKGWAQGDSLGSP